MTRVCLRCATPKRSFRETCIPCDGATPTYRGEERRALCRDCRHWGGTCNAISSSNIISRTVKSSNIWPKLARTSYACPAFEKTYGATVPSPHPLPIQERNEIEQYLKNPLAFWHDPTRWDGVTDERKQMFWVKRSRGN